MQCAARAAPVLLLRAYAVTNDSSAWQSAMLEKHGPASKEATASLAAVESVGDLLGSFRLAQEEGVVASPKEDIGVQLHGGPRKMGRISIQV